MRRLILSAKDLDFTVSREGLCTATEYCQHVMQSLIIRYIIHTIIIDVTIVTNVKETDNYISAVNDISDYVTVEKEIYESRKIYNLAGAGEIHGC